MKHNYGDILDRIPEPPTWFDEQGVPRYVDFHPMFMDIYTRETALLKISCQGCGRTYAAALCHDRYETGDKRTLAELIQDGAIHYGDPPRSNPDCCNAGPTMNSIPKRVLQYWIREEARSEWRRDASLEIEIQDPYGDDSP